MLDTIRVEMLGASTLSAAELRLLPLLATHLTLAEIGQRLDLSRNTVKTGDLHVSEARGVDAERGHPPGRGDRSAQPLAERTEKSTTSAVNSLRVSITTAAASRAPASGGK
jgi:hypothetical protein